MCPYYITDTTPLCHVKVSLADSPGQSVWSQHLCHIYIHRSPHYTIYVSLLYHWHIPSVMSRSVCLIPLVSLPDPNIYVIYTSTEVHIIQYMCPYYITDTSPLCHVKVSLSDSPGQSVWSPYYVIYTSTEVHIIQYMCPYYITDTSPLSCQGQSVWFPWSVCLIPTSMSYIHPQKSIKYNICAPTISLTHPLYVMSRSVWLIPLVSLSDPNIYVIYTSTEVHIIQYMCPYNNTDTSPLCHVKVSLADSLVSLSDPHIYVIYTSTEVHIIQYMSLLYHWHIPSMSCQGQSGWFPLSVCLIPILCHIYIHRSPHYTIYVSLLYHWHIPSMSCQGQSGWFPWSVCLIPTSMSYIHPQKSIKYNICVPTITLTHPLYVMSRSVCLIPLVSLPDPHFYVIYTSTEVHQIQYMCPCYITDTSPLCHVKVSLSDSPGQSVWSPYYVIYTSTEVHQIQYMCPYYITDTSPLCHVKVSLSDSLVSLPDPHFYVIYTSTEVHIIQYMCPYHITDTTPLSCQGQSVWFPWSVCLIPTSMSYIHPQKSTLYNICAPTISLTQPLCHVKVSLSDSPGQSAWSPLLCHIYIHRSPHYTIYVSLLYHWHNPSVMSRSVWLIPLVSLPDPHIYVIYTSTEVHQIIYMYPYNNTDTSPLCHVKVSLADSPGQSVWSPYYVIYTSTEVHQIQYMCPYYITDPSSLCHVKFSLADSPGQSAWSPYYVIYTSTEVHQIQYMCPYNNTDTSPLCHVKVSLADSPGQSVWSPLLCHIYIHRSPSNTIYVSLLYHWHIPSVMSRSVWLILLVSLPDPHIYVIYTSTEVDQIQYMYPYYITDPSPLCHVKVSLADSPGQSAWSPNLCIHPQKSIKYIIYNVPTISLTHPLYVMSRSVWPINMVSMVNSHMFIEIHKSQQNLYNNFFVTVCRHNGHYWYCATHIGQM